MDISVSGKITDPSRNKLGCILGNHRMEQIKFKKDLRLGVEIAKVNGLF
jgi:hypothetical protein